MTLKKALIIGGFFSVVATAGLLGLAPQSASAALPANPTVTGVAPTPVDSDPNGGHVFYLRGNGDLGENTDIQLKAYYSSTTGWAYQRIRIQPGSGSDSDQVCSANHVDSIGNNDTYIKVILTGGSGATNTYDIPYKNVCASPDTKTNSTTNSNNNQLYNEYALPAAGSAAPAGNVNGASMYVVNIQIKYVARVSADGNQGRIRMLVKSDNPSGAPQAKIGEAGNGSTDFGIIGDYDKRNNHDTSIAIPFGYCGADIGSNNKIALYDPDNGLSFAKFGSFVHFKVMDTTTNKLVTIAHIKDTAPASAGGAPNVNKDLDAKTYQPANGEVRTIIATLGDGLNKSDTYAFIIEGLDASNTIIIGLPTQSIGGDQDVCGGSNRATVNVAPYATGDAEVETGSQTTISGGVTVSGFPATNQYGYNEDAVQKAVNSGIDWSRQTYDANRQNNPYGEAKVAIRCADGTYDAPSGGDPACKGHGKNIGTARKPNMVKYWCSNGTYSDSCGSNNYTYTCVDAQGVRNSGSNASSADPSPDKCALYHYFCKNSSGDWNTNNSVRDGFSGEGNNLCNNEWTCPGPSVLGSPQYGGKPDNGGGCRILRCAVASDNIVGANQPDGRDTRKAAADGKFYDIKWDRSKGEVGISGQLSQDDFGGSCAYRCSGGYGATPPATVPSNDNHHCYIQASFTITCTWTGAGTSGGSITQTVTRSGEYCTSSTTATRGTVGQVCATITPRASGWSSPPPGWHGPSRTQAKIWSIVIDPSNATACNQFGQKPYLKVFNGDVESGSYVTYDGQTAQCAKNNAASVKTWNQGNGDYAGSGTTAGLVAIGNVNGFRSGAGVGQAVLSQKGLTFANTINNADADVNPTYGGSYGTPDVDCSDYTALIKSNPHFGTDGTLATLAGATINDNGMQPADGGSINGNTVDPLMKPIANRSIANHNGGVYVHKGDLYITDNITYFAAGVSNIALLPYFKIIVLGNIYINGSVTQLAGSYVAVDVGTVNGKGTGSIITCNGATNLSSAAYMAQNCANPLKVNGTLQAKSIKFYRVWETLRDSSNTEMSATTKAAESVDYGPDSWLPRGLDLDEVDGQYDSITGLPPIL